MSTAQEIYTGSRMVLLVSCVPSLNPDLESFFHFSVLFYPWISTQAGCHLALVALSWCNSVGINLLVLVYVEFELVLPRSELGTHPLLTTAPSLTL